MDGIMRIAVITDVHANLPALTVALATIDALGCERIVHVGDAIGIGPFPAETLALLLAQPRIDFVMGNHDALFAHGMPKPRPAWMSPGEAAHQRWTHAVLDRHDPTLRARVQQWPWQRDEVVNGVRLRWRHYAAATDGGMFAAIERDPDGATLDRLFLVGEPPDQAPQVVFFGHHHPAMDRHGDSGVRYCNPGALGCAHDGEGVARFAVLELADGQGSLTHHAAPYDIDPVLQALEERQVPDRELIRRIFFGR